MIRLKRILSKSEYSYIRRELPAPRVPPVAVPVAVPEDPQYDTKETKLAAANMFLLIGINGDRWILDKGGNASLKQGGQKHLADGNGLQ